MHICLQTLPYVYGEALTLKTLAVRVPEETEREIQEVAEHEKLDKATAVRALLQRGIDDWRRETALGLLRDGKVTFARAAELARLSLWEFADLVKVSGVEWVRFEPGDVEREAEEAKEPI